MTMQGISAPDPHGALAPSSSGAMTVLILLAGRMSPQMQKMAAFYESPIPKKVRVTCDAWKH